MNAKVCRSVLLLALPLLLYPQGCMAMEFPYLLQDPLRTMPDAVTNFSVTLPGDSSPIPRTATADFARPLTLAEAVDLALANNQKVKGAWADIKVQAGALGEAKAAYLPTISGGANWTKDSIHYSNPLYGSTDTNSFTGQATASWRIFDFGGRAANRRSNEQLLTAAFATYDATLQDALSAVIQNYFDAVTAAATLKARIEEEKTAQGTYRAAQVREANGAVSRSDTLRSQTAFAKAALERSRAQGDYQKAVAVLRHELGLPGATPLLLPDDLGAPHGTATEGKALSQWLKTAEQHHPAIESARRQLAAAKEQLTVVRSSGLPTLNLSGNFYQNTRPGESITASDAIETTLVVGVSVPIFEGFATTYKLRGAQAKMEKQQAILADTEQQVAMNVIKAYADATAALDNLTASATLQDSAQQALEVSQRKYGMGAADITEVLSTQSALADAMNERIRCLSEWNAARLQLLASAGRMGRSAIAR